MIKFIEDAGKWIDSSFDIVEHSKYECDKYHIQVVIPGNSKLINVRCPLCRK